MDVVCLGKDEKERMRPERMGDDLQSTDQVSFTLQIGEAEGAHSSATAPATAHPPAPATTEPLAMQVCSPR